MKLYFVALDDDNDEPDAMDARVAKHYEDTNYRVSNLTWVIAADATSPGEVCRKLGMDKQAAGKQRASGVVAVIADYSGYADKSLWQLMRGWLAS